MLNLLLSICTLKRIVDSNYTVLWVGLLLSQIEIFIKLRMSHNIEFDFHLLAVLRVNHGYSTRYRLGYRLRWQLAPIDETRWLLTPRSTYRWLLISPLSFSPSWCTWYSYVIAKFWCNISSFCFGERRKKKVWLYMVAWKTTIVKKIS